MITSLQSNIHGPKNVLRFRAPGHAIAGFCVGMLGCAPLNAQDLSHGVASARPSRSPDGLSKNSRQPVWKMPAAPVTWTITFKYAGTPAAEESENKPSRVRVVCIGGDSLEVIQCPKRTLEVWKTRGGTFTSLAESNEVSLRTPIPATAVIDASANVQNLKKARDGTVSAEVNGLPMTLGFEDPDWADLSEFDWLSGAVQLGRIEVAGEACIVFSDCDLRDLVGAGRAQPGTATKHPPGPIGGLPLRPGLRVAAVSEATLLPKYLQIGTELRAYEFSKPVQDKLGLPPKILKQLEPTTPPIRGAKAVLFVP